MRTKIAAATFLLFGAGATTVGALSNINMLGSDTLNLITTRLVSAVTLECPGAVGIVYGGTGSGNGEGNMTRTWKGLVTGAARQTISPMSRFLQAQGANKTCEVRGCVTSKKACTADADCLYNGDTCSGGRCVSTPLSCLTDAECSAVTGGDTCGPGGTSAEGIAFALDGLAIGGNTAKSDGCGGISHTRAIAVTDVNSDGLVCPGCDGSNNYAPTAWTNPGSGITFDPALDFLRVLFYGIHHEGTRNCGSDVRRTLARDIKNIYESPATCTGATCPVATVSATGVHTGGLRHIWRRDDGSGTTDVFNTLIGGATNQFCNACPTGATCTFPAAQGTDFLDNDAVRVNCDGNGRTAGHQVCGDAKDPTKLKNLGLLLTVFIPRNLDVPASDTYPAGVCGGTVKLLPATSPDLHRQVPGEQHVVHREMLRQGYPAGSDSGWLQRQLLAGFRSGGRLPDSRSRRNRVPGSEPLAAQARRRDPAGLLLPTRRRRGPALHRGVLQDPRHGVREPRHRRLHRRAVVNRADRLPLWVRRSLQHRLPGQQRRRSTRAPDRPADQGRAPERGHDRRRLLHPSSQDLLQHDDRLREDRGPGVELAKCVSNDALMAPIIPSEGFFLLPAVPVAGGTHRALCEDFPENLPDRGRPTGSHRARAVAWR